MLCNVISVLPREYNCAIEVSKPTDSEEEEEIMKHKPVYYFVMNNSCIEEHIAFFERPREGIKSHLRLFFIRAKVEDTIVNKILMDRGVVVNLMLRFLLRP